MAKGFCSDTKKWKTTQPTWWTHCQSLKICTTEKDNVRSWVVIVRIFFILCGCLSVHINIFISIGESISFLQFNSDSKVHPWSFSKSHHVKLFILFWKVVFWASFEKRFVVSYQWPSDFKIQIHDFIFTSLLFLQWC